MRKAGQKLLKLDNGEKLWPWNRKRRLQIKWRTDLWSKSNSGAVEKAIQLFGRIVLSCLCIQPNWWKPLKSDTDPKLPNNPNCSIHFWYATVNPPGWLKHWIILLGIPWISIYITYESDVFVANRIQSKKWGYLSWKPVAFVEVRSEVSRMIDFFYWNDWKNYPDHQIKTKQRGTQQKPKKIVSIWKWKMEYSKYEKKNWSKWQIKKTFEYLSQTEDLPILHQV